MIGCHWWPYYKQGRNSPNEISEKSWSKSTLEILLTWFDFDFDQLFSEILSMLEFSGNVQSKKHSTNMDKKRIRTHDDILDLISQYDQEERTKRRKKKGKEWEEDSDEDYSKKKAKLKEAYTEYTPDEDEAIVLAKPVFPLIRDKWNSLQMPSTIVKEELPETTNAFLLYDVLSKQHCKLLIDAAENQEFQYAEEYSHLYKERYHDRLVFEDENLASILYSRMHKFLPRLVGTVDCADINLQNCE